MNKLFCILLISISFYVGTSFSPPSRLPAFATASMFGIKTVVIDAGHGGKDPGCLGTKHKEKDAALAIALKLGKYITQKMPEVKVIYTRKTDIFIDLDERAAIANRNKADLFICIHCNASERKDPYGSETFVMGLHKTNANLTVAKRENAAILLEKNYRKRYDGFDPNSATGYILLTMQQSAYLKQSVNFAAKVQKQLKEKAGRADKGVQQAGFLVLWRTSMPSVLIETEFLTTPESEKMLGSDNGQDIFARSIFSAFRQYKDEVEGKLTKYNDDIENMPAYNLANDTTSTKELKEQKGNKSESLPERKDSINKKEPIIESDDKIKTAPKDSFLSLLPSIKNDSTNALSPVKKENESGFVVVYKIQFMSSGERIPLLSDKFKGLKEVGEYKDGALYKYTAGEFKTIEEALQYRGGIQKLNQKDCFVVKFKNGIRMKN